MLYIFFRKVYSIREKHTWIITKFNRSRANIFHIIVTKLKIFNIPRILSVCVLFSFSYIKILFMDWKLKNIYKVNIRSTRFVFFFYHLIILKIISIALYLLRPFSSIWPLLLFTCIYVLFVVFFHLRLEFSFCNIF